MKTNIALVWGGYSSERIVSEKSKESLYKFLDKEKYNVFKVEITQEEWNVEHNNNIIKVDKNYFGFVCPDIKKEIKFDFAYITIHGTPGENGLLQGYLEMLNVPHSTCNVETSALLFNKFFCNSFLSKFGVNVADSILLRTKNDVSIDDIERKLGLPAFVKPNIGGSSFATTKVNDKHKLMEAIDEAMTEASQVIIESFIQGIEVTCGCYKIGDIVHTLPITEIVTENDFFDYEAKYEGASQEITPARISDHLTKKIGELTKEIYNLVGAKGIIRADFIISGKNVYLLEVNTTPGMTDASFIPQQISAANLNITDVLTSIIENELLNEKIQGK